MDFYSTVCRLCQSPNETCKTWIELFSNQNKNLSAKIQDFANIALSANDGLPNRICGNCHQNVEHAYNFKRQVEITDAKLRQEMEFLCKANVNPSNKFLAIHKEKTISSNLVTEVTVKTETFDDEHDSFPPISEESNGQEDFPSANVEAELKVDMNCDSINDESTQSEESDIENDHLTFRTETSKEEMKPRDNGKTSNTCDICESVFSTRRLLNEHKRSVHGKQRYQCKQCFKYFPRKSRLRDHELQHTGIRQFECPECDKKYATQSGLKTHIEDVHTDDLPYVCDKCGKGFSKEGKLRYHYAVHIETRDFICEECNKGFKTQAHLNLHKSTHLPPDKKKIRAPRNRKKICVCPYCGKVSSSIGVHSMHIRTHTGEQRYECHICLKRFTSSGSHKKHLRVHTGEKPYVCEYCQKPFRQKHHMDSHIRGVHTNEKPYQCKVCPRAFATLGNMRLHERSHGEPVCKQEPYSVVQVEFEPMIDSQSSQSSSVLVHSTPSPMMNPGVMIPPGLGLYVTDQTQ